MASALSRDAYAGRKPALTPSQARELVAHAAAGERKPDLARGFGISRETVVPARHRGGSCRG